MLYNSVLLLYHILVKLLLWKMHIKLWRKADLSFCWVFLVPQTRQNRITTGLNRPNYSAKKMLTHRFYYKMTCIRDIGFCIYLQQVVRSWECTLTDVRKFFFNCHITKIARFISHDKWKLDISYNTMQLSRHKNKNHGKNIFITSVSAVSNIYSVISRNLDLLV